jgi:hypothetical protein
MQMNHILSLITLLFIVLFSACKQNATYRPIQGDILFQDIDCGPLCDAIEQVTTSVESYHFSHMGLVYIDSLGNSQIIESIGDRVQLTSYHNFLNRSMTTSHQPKVIAMRSDFSKDELNRAVDIALREVGVPYDELFLPDNQKWYCSELIAHAFNRAMHKTVFESAPMTYKLPGKQEYDPSWIRYFNDLNTPIPEGLPGCNPGAMSQSTYLKVIYRYY